MPICRNCGENKNLYINGYCEECYENLPKELREQRQCKNCNTYISLSEYNSNEHYCTSCYSKINKAKHREELLNKVLSNKLFILSLLVVIGVVIYIFAPLYLVGYLAVISFSWLASLWNKVDESVEETKEQVKEDMKKHNFKSSKKVFISDKKTFEVDTIQRQIAICDWSWGKIDYITYNNILDVELLENDNVVMRGGVGRAIVGDVIAGGVGAVVGATTRKSKNFMRIEVRILLKNISNSIYSIKFGEFEVNSPDNLKSRKSANEIYGIIKAILNDSNNNVHRENSIMNNNSDISNLEKLAELKEKGVISEQEFEESKKKILGKL